MEAKKKVPMFFLLLLSIVEADKKVNKGVPPPNLNNVQVWFYKLQNAD